MHGSGVVRGLWRFNFGTERHTYSGSCQHHGVLGGPGLWVHDQAIRHRRPVVLGCSDERSSAILGHLATKASHFRGSHKGRAAVRHRTWRPLNFRHSFNGLYSAPNRVSGWDLCSIRIRVSSHALICSLRTLCSIFVYFLPNLLM